MIFDKLKNANLYYKLGQKFETAFEYIKNNNLKDFENGKYEINGENIFVSIQDYTTKSKDESKFEAHKKYADIQIILKGKEQLGFGSIENFSEIGCFDTERDIVFLNGEGDFVKASVGDFLIFMPQDAHMPCITIDKPEYVKKAVVKIKL